MAECCSPELLTPVGEGDVESFGVAAFASREKAARHSDRDMP